MTTKTIFQRANNNRLQRLVMKIKYTDNLPYNPKFNPNLEIYNQPLNK